MALKLSKAEIVQIFAARALGMSLRKIAKRHGIAPNTVRYILNGKYGYANAQQIYRQQWFLVKAAAERAWARRRKATP